MPKQTKVFNGKHYVLEESVNADYSFIKAYKADTMGNLIFRKTSRNFNKDMSMASKITIAEVEEIVEPGQLAPDEIHCPGIFVKRVVKGERFEHRLENIRKDTCAETQKMNTDRIKEYVSKMILLPRKKPSKNPQVLEATPDQVKAAQTHQQNTSKTVIPLPKPSSAFSFGQITKQMQDEIVYKTLRKEWKEESGFNRRMEAKKKRAAAPKK